MNDQHGEGHRDLGPDDCILALCLEQCHRHDIEVCGHRGHQGAAVACGQTKRADNNRVCALRDQKRNADSDCDNRERRKAVAHDHGEQCHGNAVYGGSRKQVTGRDYGADAVGNDITDTGSCKEGTESG